MQAKTTIIISVYTDAEALRAILTALNMQSERDFSILVSEDGESQQIAQVVSGVKIHGKNPIHLTQADQGFRKNRALNRAVLAAPTEHLIFIDGDCVPHPHFIEGHVAYAEHGTVNCGRRVELGKSFSAQLREEPTLIINRLSNPVSYVANCLSLYHDKVKNYELGFYLPSLQKLSRKPTSIMGCNFSLYREDIIAINGFNEEYVSPGFGEDSDIAVRLSKNGCRLLSNKLVTIQYHLYHPRGDRGSNENKLLLKNAELSSSVICEHGISTHY